MYRITIALCTFLCIANGLATEDNVYLESLAANIEKSGLLPNFPQAWRAHIDSWNHFQELVNETRNHTWIGHNDTWTHNDTWPQNGTWPTPAKFNCNTNASEVETEHTIHSLHPRHIGVVGAMGASIVAGTGAGATRLLEVPIQYRGLSFPIGGDGSLNDTLTLPNIIKEYNSHLRGYSRSIAPAWFEELSRFNVAVPGATASDLEDQAKELVKRINNWPGAREQWKVITIFGGVNDLCQACDQRMRGRASTYSRRIKDALDKLQKELTRTVVNVVALPPIHQWYRQLHDDRVCWALHSYMCPCINNPKSDFMAGEYNAELYKLAPQYQKVDFAVVIQPFMSGQTTLPKVTINGSDRTDQSLFAPDCFHLSRKGHAVAARALWTNMFQAVGRKSTTFSFTEDEITCPDENCPYVRTQRNSRSCQSPKARLSTILANLTNSTWPSHHPHWNLTNVTWPTPFPHWNWTNFTWPTPFPLWNLSEYWNHSFVHTLKPWHRGMIRLSQVAYGPNAPSASEGATAAWIAFGVVLALAVVATAVAGYVDMKRRNGRAYRHGERQPLLTGSNVEQAF